MSGSLAIRFRKAHHGRLAVEHGLVHVHVDDLGAVLHLLARHRQGFLVLLVEDHAREGLGAGDVGALADVDEQAIGANEHRLQAGEFHGGDRGGGSSGHGSPVQSVGGEKQRDKDR